MTTKQLWKHLELSGDIDDYARATEEEGARKELRAIERACEDIYLHGFTGMSDTSRELLFSIGKESTGVTE